LFWSSGTTTHAAAKDEAVPHVLLLEQLDDPREQRHVRAWQQRDTDHVDVLLDRGGDDLLETATQARVDHLHPGVAQRAGGGLDPAVVDVETDVVR
jgi:hypothetical protein